MMPNKLLENLSPSVLIIFGITGDLSKKKLLPALYGLLKSNSLPEQFEIIGVTRRELTKNELLELILASVRAAGMKPDQAVIHKMNNMLQVWCMDLNAVEGYINLYDHINSIEERYDTHLNRLYYLSIPPQVFGPVVKLLGESGHNASCLHGAASTRLLIEKPFGYDLQSAKELIKEIDQAYGDFQVYRIDHYLAKETVQNILTFRTNNPLFEAVWNNKEISHIIISATETIDIQDRVAFYEQTGALRDLIQSHLMQLLAIITMEPPASMKSKDIHNAKIRLLRSVKPIMPNNFASQVVLGQYENYRKDVKNYNSTTETYAAIRLNIKNRRWKNTPIFLRTGKSLDKKSSTITIVFKAHRAGEPRNRLTFHLQPDEGISVYLQAKKPGLTSEVSEVAMKFTYEQSFGSEHPDAYERVLLDAVKGDKTLFSSSEEVLASWKVIESVVKNPQQKIFAYKAGTAGPDEANTLLQPFDTIWL